MAFIISLVGGGGKTSIMNYLAKEYSKSGKKVIITTTTHIKRPDFITPLILIKDFFVGNDFNVKADNEIECDSKVKTNKDFDCEYSDKLDEFNNQVEKLFNDNDIICIANEEINGKLSGVSFFVLEKLSKLDVIIIIEADGAKMLPVKAPLEHEPVIFDKTNIVYGVLGIDALGERIIDKGFRVERLCELLKKEKEDCFSVDDFVILFTSERGLRKSVTNNMKYIPVISKVDNEERKAQAKCIVEILDNEYGLKANKASFGHFKEWRFI